jgi:hypothetical protein
MIFQLHDGGKILLVEDRTHIHYTMYLGRDTDRPSASKLTNFLTVTSVHVRAGFEPTRAGGERPRVVRPMSFFSLMP